MSIFSATYTEARRKFLEACADLAAFATQYELVDFKGPEGEALVIDAVRFGSASAHTVLLCVSGTHGAEGFPGSGVQLAWIKKNRELLRNGLPAEIAVWIVHAVNPYGFAWQLRNNENNVDLNRNWIDFGKPLPESPDFGALYPLVTPAAVDARTLDTHVQGLLKLVERYGEAWVENVMTRGQYHYPDAVGFGGREPQFSRLAMTDLIENHMNGAHRVAYVDLHSGTPDLGELIFLCFSSPESPAFARAAGWWGADNLDKKTVDEKWGGKRPDRHGLMYRGLEDVFGPEVELSGAVVEFGTVEVGDRLTYVESALLEYYLRYRANYHDESSRPLIAKVRKAFDRTGNAEWERRVADRGCAVLDSALRGALEWSEEPPLAPRLTIPAVQSSS